MTSLETWMLVLNALMAVGTFGALVVAIIALNKKSDAQISPQPLLVQIRKALHEEFAKKEEFDRHVTINTERHSQLFKLIEKAQETARTELHQEINEIQADRARTMEKLNEQFTFIRESLAAINTELKINRKKMS
jgi:hypothetical protein